MAEWWSIVLPGGTEFDLLEINGCRVVAPHGAGMPPVVNTINPYALLDGASYQRTQAQPRILTIEFWVWDLVARANYYALRRALIEAINPHRATLPIEVRHYVDADYRSIYCYYEAGLELEEEIDSIEHISLRLIAPDPFFYGAEETAPFDPPETLDTITVRGVLRSNDGAWDIMGGATNGSVLAFARNQVGGTYATGGFTVIGGVAAQHIAYYNGSTWAPVGAGLDDVGRALVVAPNGDVYVGGDFHNRAGGGLALWHIAMWDGANWNALGAGLDNYVRALGYSPGGYLYAGGAFHDRQGGGLPMAHIGRWDGANWAALGAGVDDVVYTLLVTWPNGEVIAGGAFHNSGVVIAEHIAIYRNGLWNQMIWNAAGSGLNAAVYALAMDADHVYATGAFTTAGSIAALYVAVWNGASWSPLGAGLDATGLAMFLTVNGMLLVAGMFDQAGGLDISRVAAWNGYSWVSLGLVIPTGGVNYVYALIQEAYHEGVLYYGGDFNTTITTNGQATITNPGNARSYPVISIYFPPNIIGITAQLLLIKNETNGKTLWFDFDMLQGESLIIDTRPGQKRVYSTFRGALVGNTPLPGSQPSTWCLEPGANVISMLVDDVTGVGNSEITYAYDPAHWGID